MHNTLKDFSLFKGMDDDFFKRAVPYFKKIHLAKSAFLGSDDTMKYFYLIEKGKIKATKVSSENGRTITLFLFMKGDGFDIIPLLDGVENIAEFVTLQKTELLRVESKQIRKWIEIYPALSRNFLMYLADKMKELEELTESLIFNDTKTRLAKLILKYAQKEQSNLHNAASVKTIENLSHETLAEMIGNVRSVATTQLQALKKDGVILDEKGSIIINDLKKLENECKEFFNVS